MKKFFAAVLLTIAVLVTSCSTSESEAVANDQLLSAGLISTPESNSENSENATVIPNNSVNGTTTSTAVSEPTTESTDSVR